MKRDKVSWGIQGQRQTWTRLHKTSQRVCRSGFLYLRKVKEPEYDPLFKDLTLEDLEYLQKIVGDIIDDKVSRIVHPTPEENAEITVAALTDPDCPPLGVTFDLVIAHMIENDPEFRAALVRRLTDEYDNIENLNGFLCQFMLEYGKGK